VYHLPNGAALNISFLFIHDSYSVDFAGEVMYLSAGTVKMTLTVQDWPFRSVVNTFGVVFNVAWRGDDVDSCGNTVQPTVNSNGILSWLQISVANVAMYGNFLPVGLVDNRARSLSVQFLPDTSVENTAIVTTPSFMQQLILDPDFSVLLHNIAPSAACGGTVTLPVWMIVVVVCAFALIVITAFVIFMLHKRRRDQERLDFHIKLQKLAESNSTNSYDKRSSVSSF